MEISALNNVLQLILACLPFLLGIYCFFSGKEKLGLALLFIGAFLLRLLMATLDPYLHDWDERFHALVAKNMMQNPWMPMLRVDPVLPYDYKAWCCNHIWVHKQPLFMWQMALSMKVFGVNEVAMRLPSALMGAIGVLLTYRVAVLWMKEKAVAYLAAVLIGLSYYQLEMISGRFKLEQNDVAYHFYVLASIWAYMEYRNQHEKPFRWLLLLGLFVGCAVLNKWLTGLLVFAGWGAMLLATPAERGKLKNWLHMALALGVAVVVFLPWQIYTAYRFPLEAAWEQYHNYLHIVEPLDGHEGDMLFHVRYMLAHYGITLLPFMAAGLVLLFSKSWIRRPYTLEMLVMVAVIYLFFSQVKTKMPAFTFVVAPIFFTMAAYGLQLAYNWAVSRMPKVVLAVMMIAVVLFAFRPWAVVEYRANSKAGRIAKIHNTQVYKKVGKTLAKDYIVFNCKSFEDTEMMFYTGLNVYAWYPEARVLDSLIQAGHKVAIFQGHGMQPVPAEINKHPQIKVLSMELH